jgi:hypothetical protein
MGVDLGYFGEESEFDESFMIGSTAQDRYLA